MMKTEIKYRQIFCKRLKEARLAKGLSQKKLGILAGIDEFVASTRINRYEKGIYEPNLETSGKLAEVLELPLAYFYAEDELVDLIVAYAKSCQDCTGDAIEAKGFPVATPVHKKPSLPTCTTINESPSVFTPIPVNLFVP